MKTRFDDTNELTSLMHDVHFLALLWFAQLYESMESFARGRAQHALKTCNILPQLTLMNDSFIFTECKLIS